MSRVPDPLEVARGVPLVEDRLLLELLRDLNQADDLSRARGREGFFTRLLGRVTGRAWTRDQAIGASMISAQRGTLDWVSGLSGKLAVTDLVVAEVAEELARTTSRIDTLESTLAWTVEGVKELAAIVSELASETSHALADHERRISDLESSRALNDAVRRWQHPRAGIGLPHLIRALLLAREVAAGPAGEYAFRFAGTGVERELTERMLTDSPEPWYEGERSLLAMLTEAVTELPSDQHQQMLAELLGAGLSGQFVAGAGPMTQSLAIAAARAAEAGETPRDATRRALRESLGSGNRFVFSSLSVEELLRQIVGEQFAEAGHRRELLRARRSDE